MSGWSPSSNSVSLLVPTRNEEANVREFVTRAGAALGGPDKGWTIVFADDSDDATPRLIQEMADEGWPVAVRHRPAGERVESISGALLAALPTIYAEVIAVIDGDLQHPPEVLPHLLAPVTSGAADVSIGTRYRAGGSAEGLGGSWRRIASRGAGLATRLLFPNLVRCSDLSSGLFAFRRGMLDSVTFHPIGFKFLVELLVRVGPDPIAEVPYVFESRRDGLSKATVGDGITLLRQLAALRLTSTTFRPARVLVEPGLAAGPTVLAR